jgi:hypothetical protein
MPHRLPIFGSEWLLGTVLLSPLRGSLSLAGLASPGIGQVRKVKQVYMRFPRILLRASSFGAFYFKNIVATDVNLSDLFEVSHDESRSVGNDTTPVHSVMPPVRVRVVSIVIGGHRQ